MLTPSKKKIFFKVIKVLLVSIVILFVIGFIYISVNKKKLIANITQEVAEKIKGNLTYDEVNITFFRSFPNLAVSFKNVLLTDTLYAIHKHPFLKSKEVFLSLNIFKLIQRESPIGGIEIKDGLIYIYTDSTGYSNDYLTKPEKKNRDSEKKSTKDPGLKKVQFKNLHITKDDQQRKKFLQALIKEGKIKIDYEEDKVNFDFKTNMQINALAFKLKKGAYLTNKSFKTNLEFYFDKALDRLIIPEGKIEINEHPFKIDAWFDLKAEAPQFSLKVKTENIYYDSVKSILTPKIAKSLSKVALTAPINAEALITGPLKGGEPMIYITGQTRKTDMVTNFMDFTKADFNFLFTNETNKNAEPSDANSAIVISNMKALWYKFPVTADSIAIINLEIPELRARMKSKFELKNLEDLVGSSIKFNTGSGTADLNYIGPIERNTNSNSFLNGFVTVSNGDLVYVPRSVPMKKVNANIVFANSNVSVTNMSTEVYGNLITMNGTAKNLLSLINTAPNQIVLDWNINAPSLNLNPFLPLIQGRQKVSRRAESKSSLDDMANKIDLFLEESRVALKLTSGKIQYKKFTATNVLADVYLEENIYRLNNVKMQHAGGSMALNGYLKDLPNGQNEVNLNANLNSVDVAEVFKAFNNFNQDGIEAKNISGKLGATIKANLLVNKDGSPVPGSIKSKVDFSLKNGALINYEPIKRLQSFVFKNRNFNNIQFAEIKNTLDINGQNITINPMQIQSSVLAVYIEGLLTDDDRTDLSIRVPLSNLNSRDEDYVPKNKKKNEKIGTSIFLRGRRQNNGDVGFKLDLFKRYYKDNE